MNNRHSTASLLRVLRIRKMRAEIALSDQKKVVEQCKLVLGQASVKVAGLSKQLTEILNYRQLESVQAEPSKICNAMLHRKQIDYELERERYYESMAGEELHIQLAKLKQQHLVLEKIKVKQERVATLRKTQMIREDFLRQDIHEEEITQSSRNTEIR